MRKEKGFSKIILVLIIIAIFVCAGFVGKDVIKEIDKVSNVEEHYLQVEISKDLNSRLSEKLVEASKVISGTSNDISSVYNEIKLIDEYLITEGLIEADEESEKIKTANDSGEAYKRYYIVVSKFSKDEHFNGKGTTIDTGDVFTLEPIVTTLEDGTEKSTGKYELKYYDADKKVTVIDELELYKTNKT